MRGSYGEPIGMVVDEMGGVLVCDGTWWHPNTGRLKATQKFAAP
jgi:hypothetical protein